MTANEQDILKKQLRGFNINHLISLVVAVSIGVAGLIRAENKVLQSISDLKYDLQLQLKDVKTDNEAQKAEIRTLNVRIDKLEADIKELKQR